MVKTNKCNCDINSSPLTRDNGYLTDKSKLPVLEMRFGDMGDASEKGWHTLGKLECIGEGKDNYHNHGGNKVICLEKLNDIFCIYSLGLCITKTAQSSFKSIAASKIKRKCSVRQKLIVDVKSVI